MDRRNFIEKGCVVLGTAALASTPAKAIEGAISSTSTKKEQAPTGNPAYRCKITVLERKFDKALADKYIKFPDFGLCPFMKEGDEFITTGVFGNEMPEGFCPMAWQAIVIQSSQLAGGGKVYGIDDVHIACCNDGIRPVIFKLERIEG